MTPSIVSYVYDYHAQKQQACNAYMDNNVTKENVNGELLLTETWFIKLKILI